MLSSRKRLWIPQDLTTIEEESGEQIGPHVIPIIVQGEASFTRAELTNYLEKRGIETRTLFASQIWKESNQFIVHAWCNNFWEIPITFSKRPKSIQSKGCTSVR